MSTMLARQELKELDINNLFAVLEELDMEELTLEELALKEPNCKERDLAVPGFVLGDSDLQRWSSTCRHLSRAP